MGSDGEQMRRFLSERTLKELFLSEWYVRGMHTLQLDAAAREELELIAAESGGEQDRAAETFRAWQSRMAPQDVDRLDLFDAEILHAARQGYLKVLIEAKDASALFFQKAALTAPKDLADVFAQLGARDYDHAMRLRRLLITIFYAESAPFYTLRTGEGPKP